MAATPKLATEGLHRCANCNGVFGAEELKDIKDIFQRIEPGGVVPSGECPKCGALCYPTKEEGLKEFKIPATWKMSGIIYVEAKDLDEAIKKAEAAELPSSSESEYVSDSFNVDRDEAEEMNKDEEKDEEK